MFASDLLEILPVMHISVIAAPLIVLAAAAPSADAQTAWQSNRFLSPSGNISCQFDGSWLQCVTFNNGRGAMVSRWGKVLTFTGTAGFARQAPRLPYNDSWVGSGFRCDSAVSGLTCQYHWNHGFSIAREGISTF